METKVKERKNVMKLIVPHISLFKCRVCGDQRTGLLGTGERWKYKTWQCRNGCTLPVNDLKIINTIPKGNKKLRETDQQESHFTTEVTDLFCKCIGNKAYGHPFNLNVGRYYKVQKTTYHNTKTDTYSADYLTAAGNLGGRKLFKKLFVEVPKGEFDRAMIQQRFDL